MERPAHPPDPADGTPAGSLGSLFDLLPIGAYRSLPDGRQLRANAALVRLNGYDSEAELLASVRDIAVEWYVDAQRRAQFRERLERDGQLRGFVSEIYRHRTRERIWVSESAHVVRDAQGALLYYEGTVEEITDQMTAQQALRRSEEDLRQITAQMPAVVYRLLVQPDGEIRYLFVSERVREILGLEPADVMGQGRLVRMLCDAEDMPLLSEYLARARASHLPQSVELRVVLPDGQRKWIQINSASISSDALGTLRTGVILDITERKRAEAALRESEQRWKLALDSTGDGVWDVDLRTGVEVFSRRFLEMYGYAEHEIAQHQDSIDSRTHPDDIAGMLRDRQAHIEGRTPSYVNEHRVQCKDGRWKWILSRGLVIERDAQGRALRMIGTHTDITAQKQAVELQLARDRAEAADRAKSELLSRVSHELRTPLNAVLGFAQLLETDPVLSARHRPWVKHILDSGRHLLGLVDDVLDTSSAQTGQMRLVPADVPLGPVVEESWAMLAASAARQGLVCERYGLGGAPLLVRADPRRLKQVISNLLSNAIKYNRPGGRIAVRAAVLGDQVSLAVTDTGSGIAPEQMARLFHPFERLGAQHGAVEGTGLGLALARQLVEAMGGSIEASSTPGVGSTFSLRLPAAGAPPHEPA